MEIAMLKAVMECPEGKEYLSGGSIDAQQCGSISHGRLRWLAFLRALNNRMLAIAADTPAPMASKRCCPPYKVKMTPSAYHSHPSPPLVAATMRIRNHRGARQRCTRFI